MLHMLSYDAFYVVYFYDKGGMAIAVVKTNAAQTALLARLLWVEAESEVDFEKLMASNVGVNRIRADCLDFGDNCTLE